MANGNEFSGEINDSFALKNNRLTIMDLSHNKFTLQSTGFPAHLLDHPSLITLNLSKNALVGTLPNVKFSSKLGFLGMYDNKMSGSLPTSLGAMVSCTHLDLSNNAFTGPMISEIGSMQALKLLFLSNNDFDVGPVPTEYAKLNASLLEMSLRNTNRNGALPQFVTTLPKLQLLDLSRNSFTGPIPEAYGDMFNLEYLLLNANAGISGTVPDKFSQLIKLQAAYLDGTGLSGELRGVCTLPFFSVRAEEDTHALFVDCGEGVDGVQPEVVCGCTCSCCPAGIVGGCSKPAIGNLDAEWENNFQRSYDDYAVEFGTRVTARRI
eukprot:Plantae.Rhodophyta-Palmaria_palmata.ctg22921.p1 GENE.Plantae.Rhodophyta-Palmaria_palmata.ctg22921~~Plantae.Rhodophyta-Palmaria_palmata.ctg22921.p1  ORF type:complete len:350 (-),score=24.81 Plantae.Rhodophyta-Palmaria_palmata.ctg22921:18-983(-)